METILKIENIKKNYGKKEILKGISMDIKEGEIISVLGPSGCGKSTLLNIIAGIIELDDGTVYIRDKVVSAPGKCLPIENRNINMVFQDFALWPHMKAKDNIIYGLKVKKTDKQEIEERLNEVVSLLHLESLLDHYPSELSGGQQQRVAIARALITNPAIILLDEPLCNLDVQLRIEMRTEMAELFHSLKTTVFHVTHDPSEAFAMADRIVVVNNGEIDQIDTPDMCYKMPRTAMVAGLLGAGNSLMQGELIAEKKCVIYAGKELECNMFASENSANKKIELRFRPEDAVFINENMKTAIPIIVEMSTFEGSQYRVKVKTECGEDFCILHESFLETNRKGYVKIDKERLYAYGTDNV
ncbi:MAG: ABC transporter ATP-binding protein [Lachnospiraceae bacterium]